MIKKITKLLISLILLLPIKSYTIQEPQKSNDYNKIKYKACCVGKKDKCKKFCNVNISNKLKTCSLIVKHNAEVNGNLTVNGNVSIHGFYPKLCQAEQLYNLRGTITTSDNSIVQIQEIDTPNINNQTLVNVNISTDATSTGEGFYASPFKASAILYTNLPNNNNFIKLIFTSKIDFKNYQFNSIPTVNVSGTSNKPATNITLVSPNNSSYIVEGSKADISQVTKSGFNLNIKILIQLPSGPFTGFPQDLNALVSSFFSSLQVNFIVEGTH